MTCRTPIKLQYEILELSDGTTTIELNAGKIRAVTGGKYFPPPDLQNSFVSSPFIDGDRLAYSRYGNRTVSIELEITGQDHDDLQTQVRSIERMLNDASYRYLLGHGATIYLQYQWGLTPGESVYFDVFTGKLNLPRNFSAGLFWRSNYLKATLDLICKPFGRYTNQTIDTDTMENCQESYEVRDGYLTGEDQQYLINAANDWVAQTFTTTLGYDATAAGFVLERGAGDAPGDITISIYATAGGQPAGAALVSQTVDGDEIAEDGADDQEWCIVTFAAPLTLAAATMYALVINVPGAAAGDIVRVSSDSAGAYADGEALLSTDGGATWVAQAGEDCLFAVYGTAITPLYNYQDITTSAPYGDVPAKLYQKLSQNDEAGTKKVWIAKRTGSRQEDDLWIEGEGYSSFTRIVGGAHLIEQYGLYDEDASGDQWIQCRIEPAIAGIAATTQIARFNYTISDLPKGSYNVLVRAYVECEDAADYDHIAFGIGYSYGDVTVAPSATLGQYYTLAANLTAETLDLGLFTIPPIPDSDIADDNTLELRLYLYAEGALTGLEYYKVFIDYIFLCPNDEGLVIIDNVAAGDVIAMDGITERANIFILSAADLIEDIPEIEGSPFTLGRESTRIYVLRDDDKQMSFDSDITYQPLFLQV